MLAGSNVALHVCRQSVSEAWAHILVARGLIDDCYVSNKSRERGYAHPLYLYESDDELAFGNPSQPNFSPAFLCQLKKVLNLPDSLPPEDIFHYIYAVFHSPGFRSRYAEFLKIDFPRLPLTGNLELFQALVRLGGELTSLHLLESSKLNEPITEFIGTDTQVSKVIYSPDNGGTVWIDGKGSAKKSQPGTCGFAPVPEDVWNFHIGGYQVCQKWLKDRGPKKGKPGRILTTEDIAHYHKIVIALTETIRLMADIDKVIETHGGWPDAFQTKQEAES